MTAALLLPEAASESDPITALLTRDWAAFGGWSLFLGLVVFIIIGVFREWWVPGPLYRRLDEASQKQSETLATTAKTLEDQVALNDILKHFFEEVSPLRKGVGDGEAIPSRPARRSRRSKQADV